MPNETENKLMVRGAGDITIAPTAATRELTPGVWQMIGQMAPVLAKSRMFGVLRTEEAAAIMLKGFEMGLSMTASFDFVKVILGKPELIPRGALALIHQSPYVKRIEIKRLTDNKSAFVGYSCTMERSDKEFSHTSQFTMEDAKRAGLLKADSAWMSYPENMCLWRSIGFCADVVAPDVTAGMTTLMKAPEMYGVGLTEGGDVVEVTATNVPATDPVQEALQELTTQYGADNVLLVIGDKFPKTLEEIEAVRKTLQDVQP